MKIRNLLIWLGVVAATVVIWLNTPASTGSATKTAAAAPAKAEAPAVAAPVAPVKPAQVEKPVVAAAPVQAVASAAPASTTAPVDVTNPQPQSDFNALFTQSLQLLQARDVPNLIRTLMPPDEMQAMMQQTGTTTPEALEAALRQRMPNIEQRIDDMVQAMQYAQGQTPTYSADGNTATFPTDPGAARPQPLTFTKVNGYWYLR